MHKVKVPKEIYDSDLACGDYIVSCNETIAKLNELVKVIDQAKKIATDVMLKRLSATGQKHFAFEDIGTFKRTVTTCVAFPREVDGGKQVGINWLLDLLNRGLINPETLLDIQSRINKEVLEAIEDSVKDYNNQQRLKGSTDLIPDSPFHKYEVVKLSAPKTRKS